MKSRFARIALSILAAAALVFALSACAKGSPEPTPDPDPTPAPVQNKVTVEDAIRTMVTTTVGEDEYMFSYVLPQVSATVETPFVKEIQQTLDTIEATLIEPSIAALQAKGEPGVVSVDYTAKPVGDIISICVTVIDNYTNIPEAYVWNIKADGTEATLAELLAAKNVKEADLYAKIADTLQYFVTSDYEAIEQQVGKDMADDVRQADQRTLSDENIKSMPIYVNDEGRLACVAKVFTVAGAGYKVYFLDLGF